MARRHMSQEEIKNHVPPFQSKWWEERKEAIAKRVKGDDFELPF